MGRKSIKTQQESSGDETNEAMGSPDQPEGSEAASPFERGKSISKSAAARAALAEGFETPAEAVAFIKSRFGIEMGPQHFSAVKSQLKKRQGGGRTNGRRALTEGIVAGGDAGVLDALEGIKDLVDQYGAENVKRMVDLLAKS